MIKYYTGDIKPEPDVIFCFGSNPEGRHGKGAAYIAHKHFGAKYGKGEGLQGSSYAIPTKDLRISGQKSIKPSEIVKSIERLYEVARCNHSKRFMIAYRNTDKVSLSGYTGYEMIEMFNRAGDIPDNIIFSKEWFDTNRIKGATKCQ